MKVIYKPNTGDGSAFALLIPDDTSKKLVLEIAIHGRGERSAGTIENLENLVLGQKQADGTRKWPFVFEDMKKAVDQYNIIMAIPAYSSFMEPALINKVYDYCKSNYNIYEKFILTGFSLGGGAVVKYITSSLANAGRVAYAVPCAATNDVITSGATYPGNVGMSVHAFHNDKDGIVSVSSTKAIVTVLNSVEPLMTIFRQDGHGGNEKAWGLLPPKAPNGQGFTDAAENMYEVGVDCVINGPRQMRSGSAPIPKPDPTPIPVPQPVPSDLKAEFNLTEGLEITATSFEMDASASTGVKSGWDGYRWDVKPISPTSSKMWGVQPDGAYGGPKKMLNSIVDGNYQITLTVKNKEGQSASKTVKVVAKIGAPEKKPVSFEGTGLLTYSDQSTETITISFSEGKLVVKNSGGQILNL